MFHYVKGYSAIALFIFFNVCLMPVAVAQTQISELEIKTSGKYYWGDGYSQDRNEAISLARQDLVQKRYVQVRTVTELSEREENFSATSEFSSNVRVESGMELRGLDYIDIERRDGSWHVIAFISIEDFNSTVELRRNRMYNRLDNALTHYRAGRYNRSISIFKEIFSDSFFLPEPITADYERHGTNAEIREVAQEKILGWLRGIRIDVEEVNNRSTANNVEFNFNFKVTYKDEFVDNLQIGINKKNYGMHIVRNGIADVYYDLRPQFTKERIEFRLEPLIEPHVSDDARNSFERNKPLHQRFLEIDFSDHIELDFTVSRVGDHQFQFNTTAGILSVSSLEWDFGDGSRSREPNPRHTYQNMTRPKQVTLRFNQSSDLEVVKRLPPTGLATPLSGRQAPFRARNIDQPAEFTVPFQLRDYINTISGISHNEDLEVYVKRLLDSEILARAGSQSRVRRPENSYVVILNVQTGTISAILSPISRDSRFDLLSGDSSRFRENEWRVFFRGYSPLWLEFN